MVSSVECAEKVCESVILIRYPNVLLFRLDLSWNLHSNYDMCRVLVVLGQVVVFLSRSMLLGWQKATKRFLGDLFCLFGIHLV